MMESMFGGDSHANVVVLDALILANHSEQPFGSLEKIKRCFVRLNNHATKGESDERRKSRIC